MLLTGSTRPFSDRDRGGLGAKLGGKTYPNTTIPAQLQQTLTTIYQPLLELITQRSRVQIPPPQPLTRIGSEVRSENCFPALFFFTEPSPKQVLAPPQP